MTRPAEGERSAVVGFGGQFELAAHVVLAKLRTLEWIRVADPSAGVADDFQFKSSQRRHALQVKWSQLPGSFTWSDLTSGEKAKKNKKAEPGLFAKLAEAWQRLRVTSTDPLTIYLCTNNHPSNAKAPSTSPIASATAPGQPSFAAFVHQAYRPAREAIAL